MSMTSGQSTLATVTPRTEDQAPVGKGLRSYGVIGIWDAATGKLKEELVRQASPAAKVLLTPDGAHLLVKEEGGLVKRWTLEDEQEALLAHDADVSCMALDAPGYQEGGI